MKVYKKIKRTTNKESLEIHKVLCNFCGKEIHKNKFGYYEDYLSVSKEWGFHSDFDGEHHRFEICSDCYLKIIEHFKIKID